MSYKSPANICQQLIDRPSLLLASMLKSWPPVFLRVSLLATTGLLSSLVYTCSTVTKQLQQPQLLEQQLDPALRLASGCLQLVAGLLPFWPGKVFGGTSLAMCLRPAAELAAAVLQGYSKFQQRNISVNASNSSSTDSTANDGWLVVINQAIEVSANLAAAWFGEACDRNAQDDLPQVYPEDLHRFWAEPSPLFLLLVTAAALPCCIQRQDGSFEGTPPYHLQLLDALGMEFLAEPAHIPKLVETWATVASLVNYSMMIGLAQCRRKHAGLGCERPPLPMPQHQVLALMRVLLQHVVLARDIDVLGGTDRILQMLWDGYCITAAELGPPGPDGLLYLPQEAAAKGRAAHTELSAALAELVLLHLPGAVRDIINGLSSTISSSSSKIGSSSSKISSSSSGSGRDYRPPTTAHINMACSAFAAIVMPTVLTGNQFMLCLPC